jgi:hypothetical protein
VGELMSRDERWISKVKGVRDLMDEVDDNGQQPKKKKFYEGYFDQNRKRRGIVHPQLESYFRLSSYR